MALVHGPFPALNMSPEQTLLWMFDHLDEGRFDALLALMTPDAVWHRQGQRLEGHAQILASLNERSPTTRIRHLATNLLQRSATDDEVHISLYLTALKHDDGQPRSGAVTVRSAFRMAYVTTRLVRVAGAWRIAEQVIVPEFLFAQ
jgi:ketosteroid isomerase-like protein